MRTVIAIALAVALWPGLASAQSIRTVLEEFGLLHGSWAADCSRPVSVTNWYGRYRMMPNGEARLTYSSKQDASGDNVYLIRLARRLSDKEILLAEEFVRAKRTLEVVLFVEGDRYHTMSVKRADGVYQVKDGKYTDDGTPSPWLQRCR